MDEKLPELVFSDRRASASISRLVKKGKLKKLLPRVYTSNFVDPPEQVVKRHIFAILGRMYPGAVVSHRTALEGAPAPDGTIVLSYKYTKKVTLPGFIVRLIKGPGPTERDRPFLESLHLSCRPRAFLENMQPARSRGTVSKCLSTRELEERLDQVCRVGGEEALLRLEDEAKEVARELRMEQEHAALADLIGKLQGIRAATGLSSPLAMSRALGRPYDPVRLDLFQTLFAGLTSQELPLLEAPPRGPTARRCEAFFEAYFSNYIEGTEFELDEARDIVFNNKIPAQRPEDAHDILGTYRVVVDDGEMARVPRSADELESLLRARHAVLMGGRPGVGPGQLKEEPNRAGSTRFVEPELVRGTLEKAFEIYRALEHALARAMFVKFVVAEVHPFADGNGRTARVMMNAELHQGGLHRVLIPTVFRDDYLLALRALSRNRNGMPYVRMICRAQRFFSLVDFSSYEAARMVLEQCNAFAEPGEARLMMPG